MEQLSKDDYFSSPDFTEMWIFVAFLAHHFHGHFSLLASPFHTFKCSVLTSTLICFLNFPSTHIPSFLTTIYLSNNIHPSIVLVKPQICETWRIKIYKLVHIKYWSPKAIIFQSCVDVLGCVFGWNVSHHKKQNPNSFPPKYKFDPIHL